MKELIHSGVAHDDNPPGRGSGRWPYGSGENPYQHEFDFLSEVKDLKKKGFSDTEIALTLLGPEKGSKDLKAEYSIARSKTRGYNYNKAVDLLTDCKDNVSEVARRMSETDPTGKKWNESSVRSLLNQTIKDRTDRYQNTADFLRKKIDEGGSLNVSKGSELYLNVPKYTMDVAVSILEKEGYVKRWIPYIQQGTGYKSYVTVLGKPGSTFPEMNAEVKEGKLNQIFEYSPDNGKTFQAPEFPSMLDSKRVYVRYKEDGGELKDGTIELRKGVEDISLGGSRYSQVRIGVDGTHYMKGMAFYSDNIPEGYDIVYNTNKKRGTPALGEKDNSVMKLMKTNPDGTIDRDNPFGALIKSPKDKDGVLIAGGQRHYIDKNGKDQLSPINKISDEGDWDAWSRTIASQFLSKQPIKIIKQQLNDTIADRRREYQDIMNLTNPVIKKQMLEDFSNHCDSNASDLSAKGFKNQKYQVLLPVPTLKNNEVYAPQFKDGDTVALVRFPHGGIFEIPVLKVNNKNKEAKATIGDAKDAVGINKHNADILSGADFDGDTAIVIPMASNKLALAHKSPLKELEGFDPKERYKLPEGADAITPANKQKQMGIVSNLITDMTISTKASDSELARAVKHSMVVIDSEKHRLDYKQSSKDNKISDLTKKYQGLVDEYGNVIKKAGASTIVSRAGAEAHVYDRKEITRRSAMTPEELADFEAGKRVYRETGKTKFKLISDPEKMTPEEVKRYNEGKKVYRESTERVTNKVNQMDLVDDAMSLVRDKTNSKEVAYATYANELKGLANQARKEMRNIKPYKVNAQSKKVYADEVESLNRKLKIAEMNAPKETQAQILAGKIVSDRLRDRPDLDYEHRQRERAMALTRARAIVGAKKTPIDITDKEWDAIQAQAISTAKLTRILRNTDQEKFKQRATPKKANKPLTATQIARLKAMANRVDAYGDKVYNMAEIAAALGISSSTVSNYINN